MHLRYDNAMLRNANMYLLLYKIILKLYVVRTFITLLPFVETDNALTSLVSKAALKLHVYHNSAIQNNAFQLQVRRGSSGGTQSYMGITNFAWCNFKDVNRIIKIPYLVLNEKEKKNIYEVLIKLNYKTNILYYYF